MSGLAQSARQRRIDNPRKPAKVALHIPTNKSYSVVLELPGAGVELEDIEHHCIQITWAAWSDHNIWRCV